MDPGQNIRSLNLKISGAHFVSYGQIHYHITNLYCSLHTFSCIKPLLLQKAVKGHTDLSCFAFTAKGKLFP